MTIAIALIFAAIFYFATKEFESCILPLVKEHHRQIAAIAWIVLSFSLPYACSAIYHQISIF